MIFSGVWIAAAGVNSLTWRPDEALGPALPVGGLDPGVPVVRGEQPVRVEEGVGLIEAADRGAARAP